ncbi:MAG: HD domain-containing protein [Lachnospiraceae bacterium]|nr:HD domain-containing protein [Lachnospiraceae bacterium]
MKCGFRLPDNCRRIIEDLTNAGFEAYAVGGCVRDLMLGLCPKDWDITTSARPEEVKALFRRTVDTGIQHGTVTVLMKRESYEVTTYRIDGAYEDSRHPSGVSFTRELSEDLRRRDFTVNAMAYHPEKGLVDLFGGAEDLKEGIIRAVGDPAERFSEDALRILRAYRFSARLGFRIEEKTREAASRLAGTLRNISAERIRDELQGLVCSDHPEKLRDMAADGVTSVVLPELDRCMETSQKNKHHIYTVGEHTIQALMIDAKYSCLMKEDERLGAFVRLALLFHDFGKPECLTVDGEGVEHFKGHAEASERIAEGIMRRLKMDNDTISHVRALVKYHDYRPEATLQSVRRAMNKTGEETFRLLFPVRAADMLAQSRYNREEKIRYQKKLMALYAEIMQKKQCISLKDLAVDGNDLIRAGMKPGKEIGEKLNQLLQLVLEDPECNTKEYLLSKC